MFQRFIDDFKDSTGNALRLTSLAVAMSLALFVTLCFLCAAAFVYMLQNFGLIEACLTGAGVFFVAALIVGSIYLVRQERIEARAARAAERAAENAKSAMHSALADPMMVAAGLQVIRAIGIKKLIPILAVGGIALGFLASRNTQADQTPAE
jgi:hypothetical protein